MGKKRVSEQRTLKLRNQQIFLGLPYYMLDDVFQTANINKSRQLNKFSLLMCPVWALTLSLVLNHSISLVEEAHLWTEINSKVEAFLTDFERDIVDSQIMVLHEMKNAGIDITETNTKKTQNNNNSLQISLSPKRLDFETFTQEAQLHNAIVFMAFQNHDSRNDIFTSYLNHKEIVNTGHITQKLKTDFSNFQGVGNLLTHKITRKEITQLLKKVQPEDYFEYFRRLVSPMSKSIHVSSQNESSDYYDTTLNKSADLSIYLRALRDGWNLIPSNTLSDKHKNIDLSKSTSNLTLEMNFKTKNFTIQLSPNGRDCVDCMSQPRWAEVIISLIRIKNKTKMLTSSFIVNLRSKDLDKDTKMILTSPSQAVLKSMAMFGIDKKIEQIAETINFKEFAILKVYLSIKNGLLIVKEMKGALDNMTSYSTLVQQVALADPLITTSGILLKSIELACDTDIDDFYKKHSIN